MKTEPVRQYLVDALTEYYKKEHLMAADGDITQANAWSDRIWDIMGTITHKELEEWRSSGVIGND